MTLALPVAGFTPRSSRFWTLGDPDAPTLGFNAVDPYGIEWAIADPRGWRSSPPVNLGLEDKPTHGAWFGRGAYKARVVEISGAFRALCGGNIADALDDAEERLQDALDPEVDTLLAVTERVPKQLTVRPSDQVVPEAVYGQPRARRFSLVLTAADPFKYAAGAAGAEEVEFKLLDPAAVPGMTHDAVHPLDHGGIDLSALGWQHNVANIGKVPALPVLRIVGPAPNPTLTNVTTGQRFQLGRTLGPGVEALIDMEMRSVVVGGSSDFAAKGRSTFWALAKGINDVRFTADTFEPTARAYLSWRPRWK